MFENRSHAGSALGMKLSTLLPAGEYTVLGLLRGGVPIAHEVAKALGATLGAVAVRKLGVPRNPELAFGAIARYGISSARHINEAIYRRALQYFGKDELESVERGTGADLRALAGTFKDYCPDLAERDLLLCDDGMATGATMKAALDLIQDLDPASITLAVPVASPGTAAELAPWSMASANCSPQKISLPSEPSTRTSGKWARTRSWKRCAPRGEVPGPSQPNRSSCSG